MGFVMREMATGTGLGLSLAITKSTQQYFENR